MIRSELEVNPMTKRLIQRGNNVALVIEKPILQLLGIDLDTELEVVTDGRNPVISAAQASHSEADLMIVLEKVNRAHGKTLERLAR